MRPRIDIGPGKRAGERRVRRQPEAGGSACCLHQLIDRPCLTRRAVAANRAGCKAVEGFVIGWMHRDELALQMGGQFGERDAGLRQGALDLVAIRIAVGGAIEIEQPPVPGRNLHALVAERGGPTGNRSQAVERRGIAGELRKENPRSTHRLRHANTSSPEPVRQLLRPIARRLDDDVAAFER